MNDWLDAYNVTWDSPSKDASGSMPIGNGDFGANVWVEKNGDILLLLGKADAWDENSTNLKLGRVRIRLEPNPLVSGSFKQSLILRRGEIVIRAPESRAMVRIWADANRSAIRVFALGHELHLTATAEMWRTEPRAVKTQTGDLFRNLGGPDPHPTIVSPDIVLDPPDCVMWCHRNEQREHDGYEINMRLQGLAGILDKMPHPLCGRIFGAGMIGGNTFRQSATTLRSVNERRVLTLNIYTLSMRDTEVQQWREEMRWLIDRDEMSSETARTHHDQWWDEFWSRSQICVETNPDVTRGYILQRYLNACAGRGEQPIKFNGSIFTVGRRADEKNPVDDPDFRRWGGPGFWFQNMRLIYWPMLAAGDFDLMQPFFRMYREMLPLQKHRTKTYFGHGGAHYPETLNFWGAEVSAHYGWTPFEKRARPEAECSYVTYYWTCGIELTLMAYEYFSFTQDENFARETLIPIADAVMEFFDLHYPRDSAGKIRIEPGQALETWHEAVNSLPDVAGLRYTLPKLLELPTSLTTEDQRTRWARMLTELPELPIGEKNGDTVLLPAEKFDKKKNTENPELYAVFPFRLFGVGKPNLDLARRTFAHRLHVSHDCWSQDDIQMAMLGLTDQAKDFVTRRASPASSSDSRFPGFWNSFKDWSPDMDHGGVLQMALQSMLMQWEGDRILLLPAWPKEWDADFKLHAPKRTVIEGKVRGGKVVDLVVTPQERRRDIEIV